MTERITREAYERDIDVRLRGQGSSLAEFTATYNVLVAPCACEDADCRGWALRMDYPALARRYGLPFDRRLLEDFDRHLERLEDSGE